jgi:hypothetical protein
MHTLRAQHTPIAARILSVHIQDTHIFKIFCASHYCSRFPSSFLLMYEKTYKSAHLLPYLHVYVCAAWNGPDALHHVPDAVACRMHRMLLRQQRAHTRVDVRGCRIRVLGNPACLIPALGNPKCILRALGNPACLIRVLGNPDYNPGNGNSYCTIRVYGSRVLFCITRVQELGIHDYTFVAWIFQSQKCMCTCECAHVHAVYVCAYTHTEQK